MRDLAKLNDWEPVEEPSSDPAGDELLQMKKSAAATSRPDGLPPRGICGCLSVARVKCVGSKLEMFQG